DLEDTPSDSRRILVEKAIDVIPVERPTSVDAPHGTERRQPPEVTPFNVPRRNRHRYVRRYRTDPKSRPIHPPSLILAAPSFALLVARVIATIASCQSRAAAVRLRRGIPRSWNSRYRSTFELAHRTAWRKSAGTVLRYLYR